jgi:acyl transferase domain-containing protein
MKNTFIPIAVVGVGALFAGAKNPRDYWRNIIEKRNLVTEIPQSHWLIEDYFEPNREIANKNDKIYSKHGSFISDIEFDPMEFGVPPATIPAIDTSQLLALIVAKQVLNQASKNQIQSLDLSRTSVILGTSTLEAIQYLSARIQRPVWSKALREIGLSESLVQEACDRIANSYPKWQEDSFPGLLSNVVAGRIANRFNCGGTNFTTDAACAGSLAAILAAISELQLNRAEMVITGGVDTLNDLLMYKCFAIVTALSPSGQCSPFSAQADGTVLGEGIGLFALKRLSEAQANGDHIYGVIRGMGTSSDGRATSIYAPVAKAQSRAVRKAYEQADYPIDTVELIEAHGTGTIAGDLAEYNGLLEAFNASADSRPEQCALGSVKSQIGHTKSAAGAAGLLKALFALIHKTLPPTLHAEEPNHKFQLTDSPLYLNTQARPWIRSNAHPRRAGISCFGFGGSNFHMTLEEYTDAPQRAERFRLLKSEIVVVAAKTHDALVSQAKAMCQKPFLAQGLPYIANESQKSISPSLHYRLAIVATDTDDLANKLQRAIQAIEKTSELPKAQSIGSGIYYGAIKKAAPLAFCFPGHGSEYVNMVSDILMAFDPAISVWDTIANEKFADGAFLHEIVYPVPSSKPEKKALQEKRLKEARFAQPALAAASLSWLALLKCLKITPFCMGGEGFGEVIALHAADMIDAKVLWNLASQATTQETLAQAIEKLSLRKSTIPTYANQSGKPHSIKNSITQASPAFAECIRHMYQQGVRTFLEVGPNQKMAGPIKAALKDFNDYQIIHLDQPNVDSVSSFFDGLAQLFCAGFNPEFVTLWQGYETVTANKPPEKKPYVLKLNGTNYAKPYPIAMAKNTPPIRNNHEKLVMQKSSAIENFAAPITTTHHTILNGQQELQRQLVEAHNNYQNAMMQSHIAFLNTMAHMMNQENSIPATQANTVSQPTFASQIPTMGNTFVPSVAIQNNMAQPMPIAPSVQAAPPISSIANQPAQAPIVVQTPSLSVSPQPALPKIETSPAYDTYDTDPENVIISVVVEKTGYPVDMLHSDMDIEGDLGIDSIKRVEILSTVRERLPFLPEMDTAELANLKKLGDITTYIKKYMPASQLNDQPSIQFSAAENSENSVHSLRTIVLDVVVEKTGYPLEMLNEEMDIEADLGIDSIKRVEILSSIREKVPTLPEMETNELAALKTLGDITHYIQRHAPTEKATNLKKKQSIAVS